MKNLAITAIRIKNFQKIEAFTLEIDPKDNVVLLGGDNEQGKTSAIDAIDAAFTGFSKTKKSVIRTGASSASIEVDFPPYSLTRETSIGGKEVVKLTRLDDGTSIRNEKQFLEELLGGFSRPIKFMNSAPKDKRKIVADLGNINLDKFDEEIRKALDFAKTIRDQEAGLAAKLKDMPWHDDAPKEEVSMAVLLEEINQKMAVNASIDTFATEVTSLENAAAAKKLKADDIFERAKVLKAQLDALRAAHAEAKTAAETAEIDAAKAKEKLGQMKREEISHLQESANKVEETNKLVRINHAKLAAIREHEGLVKDKEMANAAVLAQQNALKAEIAKANLPVEGLGFVDGDITLDDLPFNMASHARQIAASVAISLALKGKLAPILIEDASTIGAKLMRSIAEEAKRHGAIVIAEIVANETEEGFDAPATIYISEGKNTEKGYVAPTQEKITEELVNA